MNKPSAFRKAIPVVTFERNTTYVFSSITEAALVYQVNKKTILDRIHDGCTMKDGYTTVDFLFTGSEESNGSDNSLERVPD